MARVQFTSIDEFDLGKGIDARSGENQLTPGHMEDALNVEMVETRAKKRPGYQLFSGFLPLRVSRVSVSGGQLCYEFDSGVDVKNLRSTPLIVHGKASVATGGDFETTTTTQYYPSFSTRVRKTVAAGGDTLSIDSSEHGFAGPKFFVEAVESTSFSNLSHQIVVPDALRVEQSSSDIEFDFTSAEQLSILSYYLDLNTNNTSSFVPSAAETVAAGATETFIINSTAAGSDFGGTAHNLATFNFIVQVMEDTGTEYRRLIPDAVSVDLSGNISVTVTNSNLSSSIDILPFIYAAPASQTLSGQVGPGGTVTVELAAATSPFIFTGIWLNTATTEEQVIPDSIVYDDTTQMLSVTFTSGMSETASFEIYYEYGEAFISRIYVDANVSTFTDLEPQLSVYGLDHLDVYPNPTEREGWVTHVDTYRRQAEERLISGLGGNLFRSVTADEMAMTSPLDIVPNIRNRASGDQLLYPAFHEIGDTPSRTRGYITFTADSTNLAEIISATYTSGYVDYVLHMPDRAFFSADNTQVPVITTQVEEDDYLTVTNMGRGVLNGSFRIISVTVGDGELTELSADVTTPTTIEDDVEVVGTITVSSTLTILGDDHLTIRVENASVTNSDYDEVDAGGRGGVFTDRISVVESTTRFIPGDTLVTGGSEVVTVYRVTTAGQILVSGVTDQVVFSNGSTLTGRRSSYAIISNQSVNNYAVGDVLSHPDYARLMKVISILPSADETVSISGDGSEATVTLSSSERFKVGQRIVLLNAGVYSGEWELTSVPTTTTLAFASTRTETSVAGILAGLAVQIDESLIHEDKLTGLNKFSLTRRWEAIEAPEDTFGFTKKTYGRHLDFNSYTNQPYLRSTTVLDNLFLTNGDDEVFKFDGTNLYRAGLFRHQAGLFVGEDTTPTAKIPVQSGTSIEVTGISTNRFRLEVALGDETSFITGDRIVVDDGSGNRQNVTVDKVGNDNSTKGYITLDDPVDVSLTPDTIHKVTVYRYYFRLNAVDINDRIVSSAVVGNDDFVVELSDDAAVELRLLRFPTWHIYDYDRIELQVYRTKANGQVFFKHSTIELDFENTAGYIRVVDSLRDQDLTDDEILNLKGDFLGTTWDEPMRARYVTSAGSRLILGHLSDYPQLDLLLTPETVSSTSLAGTRWLFKRNSSDTGTTTDNVNRQAFALTTTSGSVASITAGTDEFNVEITGHTLAVKDWVYLFHSDPSADNKHIFTGWFQVAAIVDVNNVTINLAGITGSTSVTQAPDSYAAGASGDIPVFLGTDGNYAGTRGNILGAASARFSKRLSDAINSAQIMTDRTLADQDTHVPWMVAYGDAAFSRGQLVVRQPRVETVTPCLVLPSSLTDFSVKVSGVNPAAGSTILFTSLQYNSRILVSYQNFPEIFDAPRAVRDSDSAIDINAADGQELTGLIPFFGESTSQGSQMEDIVIAFKTNSIYAVNVRTKEVSKIDSRGLGCTAPYSIAQVPNGIIFANESGIYRLNRAFEVIYVGRLMERKWRDGVNLSNLGLMQGHSYAFGQQYKLSVPVASGTTNSEVYVYNYSKEVQGHVGPWTRYDNHPATGWVNLRSDSYFSATSGRVFSIRRAGNLTDFRDDDQAISFELTTRAFDFGTSSRRKIFRDVITHFRAVQDTDNNQLLAALDLSSSFETTTGFEVDSSAGQSKIVSIRHNLPKQRGIYLQLKYVNAGKDEDLDLSGISFTVAGLTEKGITEAAETTSRSSS